MRRRKALGILGLAIVSVTGVILLYTAYYNTFYAIDRANALFSRAETAGFAEEMVGYLQRGRELLPRSGNPVWWFPTDKTNFTAVQKDIDGIIARATLLEDLPRNSSAYQQGMDDLRGKIRTLELQVAEASGYMFVSGWNIAISVIFLTAFGIVVLMLKKP